VRIIAVVAFLCLGLASGCGSVKREDTRAERALNQSAARFAVETQAQLRRGQYRRAWRTLHPVEKHVVSASRLASCYPRNDFAGTVTFRASRAADVTWRVPGASKSTDAKAVTVTATSPGRPKDTFIQHLVRIDGHWTWMLSRKFFEAAKNGRC
jgi:Tfp pilus assembly protein PilW